MAEPAEASFDGEHLIYAGFWRRFGAYCIDILLLALTGALLTFTIEYCSSTHFSNALFLNVALNWLYYAIMESSAHQATIGKIVFDIEVTNLEFQRISFVQASLRWFCKVFSMAIFGLGYFMIAFTQRQQALHDIMARCLVVRKQRNQ